MALNDRSVCAFSNTFGAIAATVLLLASPVVADQVRSVGRQTSTQKGRIAFMKEPEAIAAWHSGDLRTAENLYRQIEAAWPSDYTQWQLALILRDEGRVAEAKKIMHRLMKPSPRHVSTSTSDALELNQYAAVCLRTGDSQGAREALQRMGAKNWYQADLMAAEVAQGRRDYWTEAKLYRHALNQRPGDVVAKRALERAEAHLKRY